jgi:hypothetical protein
MAGGRRGDRRWCHAGISLLLLLGAGVQAWAAEPPAGQTYVVAQLQPAASDENPGTPEKPFQTIARAVKAVKAGDTVLIESGVYREAVVIEASGTADRPIVFAAAPMANVTVTGADPLTEWKREEGEGNVYSTPWAYVFCGWSQHRNHPDDDYHLTIGRCEQVFVDRYPLLQVPSRKELTRGTFYVDEEGKRLYVWARTNQELDKARLNVEASVRQLIWKCTGEYVHTRGIRFRYAASQAQSGAVAILGNHDVLEDCTIEQMNGNGASFGGEGLVVRRCVFRDNGQQGFSAHTTKMLMTECLCENNNTKDYARGWEAGGDKLCLCRDTVIEKSIFRSNHGNGVWFDIGNENCTVRNCLIADNDDAGIFYEISYGLHAHDNVIIGNGLSTSFGAWGANGGIALSSSAHCVIERNLLIANKEGFQFREQGRVTNRIAKPNEAVAIWNHDHTIRNNVLAYNRDYQTGGWFDVKDAFHWPRALQPEKAEAPLAPREQLPPGTDLDSLKEKPKGLALEDLGLKLTGNFYAVKPGQQLFLWGCTWHKHQVYPDLEPVRQTLGLESGSQVGEVQFQDWTALDLRVPADSPLLRLKCYPEGEVPGVKLGVIGK